MVSGLGRLFLHFRTKFSNCPAALPTRPLSKRMTEGRAGSDSSRCPESNFILCAAAFPIQAAKDVVLFFEWRKICGRVGAVTLRDVVDRGEPAHSECRNMRCHVAKVSNQIECPAEFMQLCFGEDAFPGASLSGKSARTTFTSTGICHVKGYTADLRTCLHITELFYPKTPRSPRVSPGAKDAGIAAAVTRSRARRTINKMRQTRAAYLRAA